MSLFHAALQPALDSDGNPISGATWNFYATTTTTPQSVYSNAALSVSLGSTVTADASGRFATIFLDETKTYRAILKTAGGATIKDIDPINAGENGADDIGFLPAGTGAVSRTVESKLRETVSVADFGAVGDGTTDDTAAIQAAIDYCATFDRWPTLVLTGRHKLASSLIIDRLVDNTLSEFRIVANGPGAGFYTTGNVTIFDSSLTVTTDPRSEWITCEGVHFETSSVFNASYVMSGKFLRMKFLNCNFRLIRCVNSAIYVQTIYFNNCNIRNNPANFITAAGSYDISFSQCVIENGSTLVRSIDASRGTNGLRIVDCVIEGIQASTVVLTGCSGVLIAGNHIEANPANDFNFWGGSITNKSIAIVGNYIYNPTGATFYHGPADNVFSSGNMAAPSVLHSNIAQVASLVSMGDSASGGISDATNSSHVNGVYRAGNAQEAWTHSANHFTKDTAGMFGFGRTPLSVVRAAFAGTDQTSSNFALAAYDSASNAILLCRNDRIIMAPALANYADDATAAAGGVPVGGLYRNGSVVQVRVS